jgi:hypothetical protein|tara:strand:+ start:740 stop:1249 length:510 start_codon:yes stop_codon:yes gene_type:complete
MKLLMEQWKKYLAEIGDLSIDPYPFKLHNAFPADDQYFYEFITDSGLQYYVGFDNDKLLGKGKLPWNIVFDVGDDGSTEMTNENEPLKIMSTIVAVIREFINTPEYHEGNLKFVFEGIPKSGSVDAMWLPTKRTNLYMKFLQKNMPPGTKVEQVGNVVKFEVPSEDEEE